MKETYKEQRTYKQLNSIVESFLINFIHETGVISDISVKTIEKAFLNMPTHKLEAYAYHLTEKQFLLNCNDQPIIGFIKCFDFLSYKKDVSTYNYFREYFNIEVLECMQNLALVAKAIQDKKALEKKINHIKEILPYLIHDKRVPEKHPVVRFFSNNTSTLAVSMLGSYKFKTKNLCKVLKTDSKHIFTIYQALIDDEEIDPTLN